MKELKMKAMKGVTLVELLVVILIVTILSVSMLPLLQPFVVEAQYAAEPIPNIGNLRTKIGLYMYDHGKLPAMATTTVSVTPEGGGAAEDVETPYIETWSATDGSAIASAGTYDMYAPTYGLFPASFSGLDLNLCEESGATDDTDPENPVALTTTVDNHIGKHCDMDFQDLKGKRSRPNHYQYVVMRNGSDYAYCLGCFGDGNGLKMGTGYAVCEMLIGGHKYVGTWKRYKPVTGSIAGETADDPATVVADRQICFTSDTTLPQGDTDKKHTFGCFVPDYQSFKNASETDTKQLNIVNTMKNYGWEF